ACTGPVVTEAPPCTPAALGEAVVDGAVAADLDLEPPPQPATVTTSAAAAMSEVGLPPKPMG
ncbi:MAG TPA: hypothetical protein VMU90_00035, partial [Solirubrobacteraceae bacterium]|nr:hypothetical protein [Solirubrobacteraceae bacterium]